MGILHYLDIAIGFAMAMVILSTLVAAASQGWIAFIRTRVRQLEHGLGALLQDLGVKDPAKLLTLVLANRNLKISDWGSTGGTGFMRWVRGFTAETVDREEFILVLLRLAAAGGEEAKDAKDATGLDPAAAAAKLTAVEQAIAQEEAHDPGLPSHVWRARALAAHVPALAGRVFSNFDNVMARVEDNVSFSGKWTSAVAAFVFLAFYPISSFDLLHRVSSNDTLREGLVETAKKVSPDKPGEVDKWLENTKASGLFGTTLSDPWWKREPWTMQKALGGVFTPGVFLTWILVSLGAPFWLGIVSNLVGLRSQMEKKATTQRDLREREFATSGSAPAGRGSGA